MAQSINQAAENKKTIIAEVVRSGEKIIIPENMTVGETIQVLRSKEEEEETITAFSEDFTSFIWEGCYALALALDHLYGWFQGMKTPGGWFEPDRLPALRSLKIGPDEAVQVPWGRFLVPHIKSIDGFFETGYYINQSGMVCFRLNATIRKKHSRHFEALCKEVRKQLREHSIYKGKAITIKFLENGRQIEFPEPVFAQISNLNPDQLIFSRDIEDVLNANVYTPITKTAQVRAAKIPLKRGILLAGPYGTGKTLISTLVKQLATSNGWTYLVCQDAREFPKCVQFARQYQPAVVFCEDIDRVTDGDRDSAMDLVLNTIDGVDSKNTEIMLVLTTNEIDNIHIGMLRPGRLDAVIEVKRPDAEAVTRLIRHYGGALLPAEEHLGTVGKLLAGNTPAVIREAVERAKLTAISIEDNADAPLHLSENALIIAANTMKMQLDLLNKEKEEDPEPMQILGAAIASGLVEGIENTLADYPSLAKRFSGGRQRAEALELAEQSVV